jgi:hypothetical protein
MEEMKDGRNGRGRTTSSRLPGQSKEKAKQFALTFRTRSWRFNDDVFPAQVVSLNITSDGFRWEDGTKMSPETKVEFRGHDGVYYLVYYWEIETLASVRPRPGEVIIGGGRVFHQ